MNNIVRLTCKSVLYFSLEDEAIFFQWISKIKCIARTTSIGDTFYIDIHRNHIDYADLKNIIGIFYRYRIDMKQLAQLLTDENRHWFARRSAPWYRRVFATSHGRSHKKAFS